MLRSNKKWIFVENNSKRQPMINLALTPENFEASASGSDFNSFDQSREEIHRKMLSSVSHDLKTPLASIIGSLEVYTRMKDKLSAEKQGTLIDVALQEAYRLDAFITNILDMAKLENHMVTPRPESVDISVMIRNCLLRLNNQLKGHAVDIQAISGTLKVTTDIVLLSRVVCLIVDNAVKHGGPATTVNVEFGKDDNQMCFIRIRDNGLGVPENRRDVIFERYTRFAKEDQQNAGTGLGLAIARAIMHLLKGEISLESPDQGGVAFALRFPQEYRA